MSPAMLFASMALLYPAEYAGPSMVVIVVIGIIGAFLIALMPSTKFFVVALCTGAALLANSAVLWIMMKQYPDLLNWIIDPRMLILGGHNFSIDVVVWLSGVAAATTVVVGAIGWLRSRYDERHLALWTIDAS